MAKHSRAERAKREAENKALSEVEAAWRAKVPPAAAKAFELEVKAARERGPVPPPPDMAPGTAPRPPRPGREPKAPKDTGRPKRRY